MKNKLLLLNIISLIIFYHVIYESVFYFFIRKGDLGITPLGFIIFYSTILEKSFFPFVIISFIINMAVSSILFYYVYKYYDKVSFFVLYLITILVFIVISVVLFVVLGLLIYITSSSVFVIYITFYALMPIMAILIPFIFKFNKIILGQRSSHTL